MSDHERPDNVEAPVAVVSGASSGIGWATVAKLREAGWDVLAGARRLDRLEALAQATGAKVAPLDVADPASVAAFAAGIEHCHLLVNNAGGALGMEPIAEADEDHWRRMWESNVAGVMRMTKAFLPALRREAGHVVVVGSVAGFEVYPGGGGYIAAKHAARAIVDTLRLELLGSGVRVSEVAPGLVETEFSLTRFDGDAERARRTYEGMQPLSADDIADCILWVSTRPPHVNVDRVVIRPVDQATARDVYRRQA